MIGEAGLSSRRGRKMLGLVGSLEIAKVMIEKAELFPRSLALREDTLECRIAHFIASANVPLAGMVTDGFPVAWVVSRTPISIHCSLRLYFLPPRLRAGGLWGASLRSFRGCSQKFLFLHTRRIGIVGLRSPHGPSSG